MNTNAQIILRPYLTERSNELAAERVYCFVVTKRATKSDILRALSDIYKTKPKEVRIVNLPSKRTTRGAKVGSRPGIRKAYVKFPAGTKIEFV